MAHKSVEQRVEELWPHIRAVLAKSAGSMFIKEIDREIAKEYPNVDTKYLEFILLELSFRGVVVQEAIDNPDSGLARDELISGLNAQDLAPEDIEFLGRYAEYQGEFEIMSKYRLF